MLLGILAEFVLLPASKAPGPMAVQWTIAYASPAYTAPYMVYSVLVNRY